MLRTMRSAKSSCFPMRHFRSHQKLTAWFALWVFLWGLALPLIGHAGLSRFLGTQVSSASAGGASGASSLLQWVSVCTSTGMAWVALADDGQVMSIVDAELSDVAPPVSAPQDMAASHCLYCVLHDSKFVLDTQVIWQVLVALLPWQAADRLVYSPAPVQVLTDAWSHRPLQPRAPPSALG